MVFATHGLLQYAIPGVNEPALVLSQLGNPPGLNGFLTASKVSSMSINADFVGLTACVTGLGRAVRGEGVISLGRAFQIAGAREVMSSLWEVADESSVLFSTVLFEQLRAGKTPRQAMRAARKEVRRAGYEHPFYWAPFVLLTD